MSAILLFAMFLLLVMVTTTSVRMIRSSNRANKDIDCVLNVGVPGPCINGKSTIIYDIVNKESGNGKSCLSVLKDMDPKVSYVYDIKNNKYRGTKSCKSLNKDCVVKVDKPGTCVNGKYNISYNVVNKELGNGKSCLDVLKGIDSSVSYEYDITNNKYTGSKSCAPLDKDCVATLATEGKCDESGAYNIVYNLDKETGNGKTCETVLKGINQDLTYTIDIENNRATGTANCQNCVLKDLYYNDCANNKTTLFLDILNNQDSKGLGKSCTSVIQADSRYSSYPFQLDTTTNNKYQASGVDCNDCTFGNIYYGDCTNNKTTLSVNVLKDPVFGKSCKIVIGSDPKYSGYPFVSNTNGTRYDAPNVTCNDCTLENISSTECKEYKQSLSVNVSKEPLFGKSCESVIDDTYSDYKGKFNRNGNKYEANNVDCSNCAVTKISDSCTNGNYEIKYDITENKSTYGENCLNVLNAIDSRPTYNLVNGQYIGTGNCSDCVLGNISSTDCKEYKQSLSLDVVNEPLFGKSCESK